MSVYFDIGDDDNTIDLLQIDSAKVALLIKQGSTAMERMGHALRDLFSAIQQIEVMCGVLKEASDPPQ